ncbi:hypothetical protein HDU67_002082 [Dinochytrium kinnereticum]|nr:hypothetical protein HDU67_002082 [Dinochytrium kinnereticum]
MSVTSEVGLSLRKAMSENKTNTIPHEVLNLIFSFVDLNSTLYSCALTCKWWSNIAIATLWEDVSLTTEVDFQRFTRCMIYSASRFNPSLETLYKISLQEITKPAATASPASNALVNVPVDGAIQDERSSVTSSLPATGGGLVQSIMNLAGSLSSVASHLALPSLPLSPATDTPSQDIFPMVITPDATVGQATSYSFFSTESPVAVKEERGGASSVTTFLKEYMEREAKESARVAAEMLPTQQAVEALLQKILEDATSTRLSIIPGHLRPSLFLFPAAVGITASTGEEGQKTPLSRDLLSTLAPLIGMVDSVAIEDANEGCWPEICLVLQTWGSKLKNLNIEAVGNMDAFDSPEDLEPVFMRVPSLEFLRLDGIPIGTNSAIYNLATYCRNLRVLTLDYCLEISMGTLPIVWNGCENLNFLGLAGIVGDQELPGSLQTHHNLRTLRLVDCDVSDATFQEVARRAPSLEMIRIVFEDDNCDGILAVSSELSDATLLAFANPQTMASRCLSTLALTRCPRMSAGALARALAAGPITKLDLHKDPDCTLGGLDDSFILELADHLSGVRVLHLYGQSALTDSAISSVFSNRATQALESLCLNNTLVTPLTLHTIFRNCRRLRALSVIDCPNLTSIDLRFLLYRSGVRSKTLENFYTSIDLTRDDLEPRRPDLPPPLSALVNVEAGYEAYVEEIPGAVEAAMEAAKEAANEVPKEDIPIEDTTPVLPSGLAPSSSVDHTAQTLPSTSNALLLSMTIGGEEAPVMVEQARKDPPIYRVPAFVKDEDRWFVDEGLDILSLWEGAVKRSMGPGKQWI